MIACYRGHKGVVQMLLNCPENNIELNAINVDGWTAFMIVCQRGHKAVVQLPLGPFRLKHRIEYNIICCIYADLRKWSQICCQITAGTFRIVHWYQHSRKFFLWFHSYNWCFFIFLYQLMLFRFYYISWCFFVLTIKHHGNGSSPFTTVDALDAPWCSWCFFGTPLSELEEAPTWVSCWGSHWSHKLI